MSDEQTKKEEALEKALQRMEEAKLHAEAAILENDYKYIRADNSYLLTRDGTKHIDIKADAVKTSNPALADRLAWRYFTEQLKADGRMFDQRTYSLRDDVEEELFNLMSSKGWVQPSDKFDYHPAFDALFSAMGNGKEENIEHLEHVITYKYCHPETHMLPCLIIYGDGSVGKNVLVDVVLYTLFDGQTTSFEGSKMFGDFQSNIVGKTVVLVNELKKTKANMEMLKNTVMAERIVINEKNIKEYTADNTPLYMIGSNDPHGPVTLGDDGSDRRWSVLHIPMGKKKGNILMEKMDKFCTENVTTLAELSDLIDKVFKNEEEVAKWIGAMIIKHGEKPLPEALHSDDMETMYNSQKTPEVEFMEWVFLHDDFKAIKMSDEWVLYKEYMKVANAPFTVSKGHHQTTLRAWLEKHEIFNIKHRAGEGAHGCYQLDGTHSTFRGVIDDTLNGKISVKEMLSFTKKLRTELAEDIIVDSTVLKNVRAELWHGKKM